MIELRKLHAAALNILARIFGVMAVLVGGVFAIWGLVLVLDHNATIDVNGVPSSDPWIKASVLVVGLVSVAIGILVLMARPYQPKEPVISLGHKDSRRSIFVYISSRLKLMPFGLRLLTGFSVFAPIFALGFYVRGDSQVPVGLPKVLLIAICCAVFVYGFLRAAWWSRPLVMLYLVGALIWAIFQNHAAYSFSDYLGSLLTIGFITWILYFRRDVRDYYAGAHKTMAS